MKFSKFSNFTQLYHNEFTVFLETFSDSRSSLTVLMIANGASNNTLQCERSPDGQLVGGDASRFSLQMVVVCTDTGTVTFIRIITNSPAS